jgi:hypothetical protein
MRASLGSLDRALGRSLNAPTDGAVAQLGERSNRTAEVTGSIPVGSTILLLLLGIASRCMMATTRADHPSASIEALPKHA